MMNTADEVLREPYITHDLPLAKAREWIKKRDKPLLAEAIKLLKELRRRHPYAMQIMPDLALALLENGDREDFERLLAECYPDPMAMTEEMLCRYGRRLRESGDSLVCLDGSSPDTNAQVALDRYGLALRQYDQAYAISQSYYPGVNIATLRLRICAISPSNSRNHRDLSAVKNLANRLMEQRQQWTRNPSASDDEVWRIATTADCHLLCEQWSMAAENYQLALRDRACQPFHVECMRRTVEGIVNCYKRIGRSDFGPFQDLRNVFGERGTG